MLYKNILLIDDDEDDAEIFLTAVSEISSSALCTALPAATLALEKLSAGEIKPDVIFLDLNMPVMSGHQFLSLVKAIDLLKHIPVIVFSTSSHQHSIDLSRELGAADFITKPALYSELTQLLKPLIIT